MWPSSTMVNGVAGAPPMVTAVAPVKPEPPMVTAVPPAVGPLGGVMVDTTGAAPKVKTTGELGPTGLVTTTLAGPLATAGVVQVSTSLPVTTTLVAGMPPKVTPVTPVKENPPIVTAVPPAGGPLLGEIDVMLGTCRLSNPATPMPP